MCGSVSFIVSNTWREDGFWHLLHDHPFHCNSPVARQNALAMGRWGNKIHSFRKTPRSSWGQYIFLKIVPFVTNFLHAVFAATFIPLPIRISNYECINRFDLFPCYERWMGIVYSMVNSWLSGSFLCIEIRALFKMLLYIHILQGHGLGIHIPFEFHLWSKRKGKVISGSG